MKKYFMLIMILISPMLWSEELNSLISHSRMSWGGFGGPTASLTMINGQPAYISGGEGALLINHRLAIGGGGGSLQNQVTQPAGGTDINYLTMSYGGMMVGYHLFARSAIHFSVYAFAGVMDLGSVDIHGNEASTTWFFVQPRINIEFRITRWMQAAIGISKVQFLDTEHYQLVTQNSMNDFRLDANIRFGWL